METEKSLEAYYSRYQEPYLSGLLALRDLILSLSPEITQVRRSQIPVFLFGDKKLGFIRVHQKKLIVGFLEDGNIHPRVNGRKRRNEITAIFISPDEDFPIFEIKAGYLRLIELYQP